MPGCSRRSSHTSVSSSEQGVSARLKKRRVTARSRFSASRTSGFWTISLSFVDHTIPRSSWLGATLWSKRSGSRSSLVGWNRQALMRQRPAHAAESRWPMQDDRGHGTKMAGLALYGDLGGAFTAPRSPSARHGR
jgi:hypothetical protein